jgi:SAM-dependent methyltransferase
MSEQQRAIIQTWDLIAAAYQERYGIDCDDLHLGPMTPGARRLGLVDDLDGRAVLEIGCGGAQNLIAAVAGGARRAVGADPSAAQLDEARRLAAEHGAAIELHALDAESIDALPADFDLVISVYALMYVERVERALAAMARRLAPGGRLIVSVDHPLRLAGEWSDDGRFEIASYFARGWQRWPFDFPERGITAELQRFHRTVGDWVAALLATGLTLTALLEPEPEAGPDAAFGSRSKHGSDSPRNVFHPDRLRRVPGTLILVADRDD